MAKSTTRSMHKTGAAKPRGAKLIVREATNNDVAALLALRLKVDADQEARFGKDRWAASITEKSVLRGLRDSKVLIAMQGTRAVGTLRVEGKKPWAIDISYFTSATKAVYLHDVETDPELRHLGIGRALIEHAMIVAKEWPADAIRLDAYDGASGGGPFYSKCGFKKRGHNVYRGVPLIYYEMLL